MNSLGTITSVPAPVPLSREHVATLLIGDRDRLAALLRRRIRGKLAAALDLDDVLDSAFRRVDQLAVRHVLRAHSPEQLSALALTIARNLALALARTTLASTQELAGEPGQALHAADERETEILIERMAVSLTAPDLELFLLKLRGLSDDEIARACKATATAIHKRWTRLRRELRIRFAPVPPG